MLPADVVEGDPKKLKRPQGKVSQLPLNSMLGSISRQANIFFQSKNGNPPTVNNEKPNKKLRSGIEEQADNATANNSVPAGNNEENLPSAPPVAEPLSS